MKSITMDSENVTIMDTDNYVGRIEELITRNEFSERYGVDLKDIISLAYEPSRNIFHVETKDGVQSFSKAEDNPYLRAISDIEDLFLKDEEIKYLESTKPSSYHTVHTELKVHVITPENQIKLNKDKREKDLQTIFTQKTTDIKALACDKTGTNEYINSQYEIYENMYDNALKGLYDTSTNAAIIKANETAKQLTSNITLLVNESRHELSRLIEIAHSNIEVKIEEFKELVLDSQNLTPLQSFVVELKGLS